jgi:hypothetical protein
MVQFSLGFDRQKGGISLVFLGIVVLCDAYPVAVID